MAIGCGAKCAKIILIVFNFVFWLSGAAILGVGIWLLVDPTIVKYLEVIQLSSEDPYLKTAAYILIGVGAFIFVVGFFGCCGAIKENKCMLGLYLFFLVIVLAGELGAGVLVAVFKPEIENQMQDGMFKKVKEDYGNGNKTSFDESWDFIQFNQKCCGMNSTANYKGSAYQNKQKATSTTKYVPLSCCVMAAGATFEKMKAEDLATCQAHAQTMEDPSASIPKNSMVHTQACYQKIVDWFGTYSTILIAVACGIAALEILGFVFAVCLCRNLGETDD